MLCSRVIDTQLPIDGMVMARTPVIIISLELTISTTTACVPSMLYRNLLEATAKYPWKSGITILKNKKIHESIRYIMLLF